MDSQLERLGNLPKEELITIFSQGFEHKMDSFTVKTAGEYFVEIRGERKRADRDGVKAETLHIGEDFDMTLLTYYAKDKGSCQSAPIKNQVKLFSWLHQNKYISLIPDKTS